MASIYRINTSNGGVPKTPIPRAAIDQDGVVGDKQQDTTHHGGPDRALCLYSIDVIRRLQDEGHPIDAGYAGENLTIAGLDWEDLTPGTRLRIGNGVEIEVTSYTTPCAKNAAWFSEGDFTRMLQARHPGESRLYARVLQPGEVENGDEVLVI